MAFVEYAMQVNPRVFGQRRMPLETARERGSEWCVASSGTAGPGEPGGQAGLRDPRLQRLRKGRMRRSTLAALYNNSYHNRDLSRGLAPVSR